MKNKAARKELIRQYKESPRPMGVYRVRNTLDERSLVGSSLDVQAMLNRHRAQLRMSSHRNARLQGDWDARGAEAFVFEVLDLLPPREEPDYDPADDLAVLEQLWLERLTPYGERGYNKPPADWSPV
ncbi:MAG: GIY-YIG nuclease family protein [Acidobacteriota bacterium]|nr:GIY-YIG nuclease family protein [Acidobacteriota bacterium]MDH3524885.1 GIY-YIG nuclease family protein [Acidobacteriota bacterium]